ncbi:glycosyltransferase [candidate division KSB1 bacterium]|nr:glycosyltransferase [candidate division KSB1 bacterium]
MKDYALNTDQSRFRVSVCGLTTGGDIVNDLQAAGIDVYLLKKSTQSTISFIQKMRFMLHEVAPDIIHVHDDMSGNWVAMILGFRKTIPVIRTIHKLYEPSPELRFRLHQLFSRLLYRFYQNIICCSESVKNSLLLSSKMSEKIVTIVNSFDFKKYEKMESAGSAVIDDTILGKSADGSFRIGTVGSLRFEKGHEYLLDAANILKDKGISAHYYFIGEGDRRSFLENRAENLNIKDIVHFIGHRKDVLQLLPGFDLIVFPSVTEGLPVAVLEALALKKTVVASAVGGIPEVIIPGETGWLVPPANAEVLAQTLGSVLRQPDTSRQLAENGHKLVMTRYNMDRMIHDTELLYEQAHSVIFRKLSASKNHKESFAYNDLRLLMVTMFPGAKNKTPPNQTAILADYFENEGAHVIRTTTETKIVLKTISIIKAMIRFRNQYDIIQIQTTPSHGFINTLVAISLGKLFKKKVVSNYFTSAGPDFLKRFRVWAVPVLNEADGIVVASDFVNSKLQALSIPTHRIPHLIDVSDWQTKIRTQFEPKLIWVKRFDPEAGPFTMLEAFRILKQKVPAASLVMVGDGPLRELCLQYIDKNNIKDIQLPGFVPRAKLQAYYDRADIFVLTSKNDNQPMTVLEAFACGLPVVATNVGGVPELVQHQKTGLLVHPDDSNGVVESVIYMLNNQTQTRTMCDTALKTLTKFQWNNLRKIWLEFFKKIVEDKSDVRNILRISEIN